VKRKLPRRDFVPDLARTIAEAIAEFCDDVGRRRKKGELPLDKPVVGVLYPADELAKRRRKRRRR